MHMEDIKPSHWISNFKTSCPVVINVNTGYEMAGVISRVVRLCEQCNSDTTVVWDTEHHTVILWFDDAKWETYFSLKGIRG